MFFSSFTSYRSHFCINIKALILGLICVGMLFFNRTTFISHKPLSTALMKALHSRLRFNDTPEEIYLLAEDPILSTDFFVVRHGCSG